MARTITVTDDDSGVVTTVVVTKDDKGYSSVKEIRFNTLNGGGLEKLDLSVLRDFGLTDRVPALPAPVTVPEPAPAAEPAAAPEPRQRRATKAKVSRRSRKTDSLGRKYRRAPDVEDLKRMFTQHGGPSAVARELGVPLHSVAGWLRRYRSMGHVFDNA